MYFSLDSVPDEQLTLYGAWMDDSDKNFPEPAQLKRFGPVMVISLQDHLIPSVPS